MIRTRRITLVFALLLTGCAKNTDSAARNDRILLCPECRLELPYSDRLDDKPCPSCGKPNIRMQALTRGETPTPPWHKAVVVFIVLAVVIQGTVYYWFQRKRTKREVTRKELGRELRCRCPYCQRKYKYQAQNAGRGVVCRQCKTAFAFPEVHEAEACD